jgi:small subunit ribosomal protein S5
MYPRNDRQRSDRPQRDHRDNRGSADASKKEQELESTTLLTRRVAKVVKGGKRMKFTAMVVVGDRAGKVGLALAKGQDPRSAIEKATTKAKKNLKKINLKETTIPFEVMEDFKSSKIFFKPAKPGTGIIASNAIRPILELAGIRDIYTKIYGTNNKVTNAYCVMSALESLSK